MVVRDTPTPVAGKGGTFPGSRMLNGYNERWVSLLFDECYAHGMCVAQWPCIGTLRDGVFKLPPDTAARTRRLAQLPQCGAPDDV